MELTERSAYEPFVRGKKVKRGFIRRGWESSVWKVLKGNDKAFQLRNCSKSELCGKLPDINIRGDKFWGQERDRRTLKIPGRYGHLGRRERNQRDNLQVDDQMAGNPKKRRAKWRMNIKYLKIATNWWVVLILILIFDIW